MMLGRKAADRVSYIGITSTPRLVSHDGNALLA